VNIVPLASTRTFRAAGGSGASLAHVVAVAIADRRSACETYTTPAVVAVARRMVAMARAFSLRRVVMVCNGRGQ
jgi:hypothetical protein